LKRLFQSFSTFLSLQNKLQIKKQPKKVIEYVRSAVQNTAGKQHIKKKLEERNEWVRKLSNYNFLSVGTQLLND